MCSSLFSFVGDVKVRDFNTCSEDQSWDGKCFEQNGYKTEELDSNKETHEKIREILITGHPRQEGTHSIVPAWIWKVGSRQVAITSSAVCFSFPICLFCFLLHRFSCILSILPNLQRNSAWVARSIVTFLGQRLLCEAL